MEAILDEQDYQTITNEVLKRIKEKYDLVPKQYKPMLISLKEFRHKYGHDKSPAWLKLYLLPKMPGVYGLNAGKGHPVRIDVGKVTRWLAQHEDKVDWNKSLPQ